MGIFVDFIPLDRYEELKKKKEEKLDEEINYLPQPHVKEKERLKVKVEKGPEVGIKKKFYPDEFPFNPYNEPRKCAKWIHKYVGDDCWAYMFEMGGQPPYRKIFKGLITRDTEGFDIKYFCKQEHDNPEYKEFDMKVIDISKPSKNYTKYAGL
jgi:hypothetical protein